MNEQRIAVITDSGTDTPAAFAAEHDVRVIPLRINYSDGSTYETAWTSRPRRSSSALPRRSPPRRSPPP